MTREQALLYLFVLHDHDRSGHLDGLELLQLLGAVLAQDGGRPDPDVVAALVDRALERQDLSRDGLLDPPELLLSPGQGQGPPGQLPGDLLAGAGAAPGGDAEAHGGDMGVEGPGHGPAEGQDALPAGARDAAALEAEGVPELEAPDAEAVEAEEAPEAGAPDAGAGEVADVSELAAPKAAATEAEEAPGSPAGEAAPVWEDPGEG
nr:cell growth regulator with EF hand domain protein 1 [Columba livia]